VPSAISDAIRNRGCRAGNRMRSERFWVLDASQPWAAIKSTGPAFTSSSPHRRTARGLPCMTFCGTNDAPASNEPGANGSRSENELLQEKGKADGRRACDTQRFEQSSGFLAEPWVGRVRAARRSAACHRREDGHFIPILEEGIQLIRQMQRIPPVDKHDRPPAGSSCFDSIG